MPRQRWLPVGQRSVGNVPLDGRPGEHHRTPTGENKRRPTSARSRFHSPRQLGHCTIPRGSFIRPNGRHRRRVIEHGDQVQNFARITDTRLSKHHRQQQGRKQFQNQRPRNGQSFASPTSRGNSNFLSPQMQTGHQQRRKPSVKQVNRQDRWQSQKTKQSERICKLHCFQTSVQDARRISARDNSSRQATASPWSAISVTGTA